MTWKIIFLQTIRQIHIKPRTWSDVYEKKKKKILNSVNSRIVHLIEPDYGLEILRYSLVYDHLPGYRQDIHRFGCIYELVRHLYTDLRCLWYTERFNTTFFCGKSKYWFLEFTVYDNRRIVVRTSLFFRHQEFLNSDTITVLFDTFETFDNVDDFS